MAIKQIQSVMYVADYQSEILGVSFPGNSIIFCIDTQATDTNRTLPTGGTITYSGGYTIHTFLAGGTFIPNGQLQVDYLVVAGGGAGGYSIASEGTGAGGGGAGGMLTGSTVVTNTSYPITVGAGGTVAYPTGGNGGNSIFSTFISIGGGAGGNGTSPSNAGSGGSGGGGGGWYSSAAGSGTGGQGNIGGAGSGHAANYGGGGGGGASAVGAVGTGVGGAGGAGTSSSISGAAVSYAGGGGGGVGTGGTGGNASGGGGAGTASYGISGTPNTGGGGGGAGSNVNGNTAIGGSGIVIIRYLTITSSFDISGRLGLGAIIPTATAGFLPMKMTAGTNLTVAEAGALEYDGVNFYQTIDTSSGRGYIPVIQRFNLAAAGGTISTIANFFGATSNIALVASAYYEIEIVMFFLKSTAGTVTWTLTNSAAPTAQNIEYEGSPIAGIVAPPGTATELEGQIYNDTTAAKTIVTGTLADAVSHYVKMRIFLKNGTGVSLKIQATCSAGTITPGIGSRWTATRISPTNVGNFIA